VMKTDRRRVLKKTIIKERLEVRGDRK